MTRTRTSPDRLADPTRRFGRLVRCAGVVTLWGAALCVLAAGAAGCQQMATAAAVKNAVPAAQEAMRTAQDAAQVAQTTAQHTVQATTQAAQKVVNTVPGAQLVLGMIPQNVQDQANSMLRAKNLDWGKPKRVYIYDGLYIFVYSDTGPFGPGKPKVVVVDSIGAIARLERLQNKGY